MNEKGGEEGVELAPVIYISVPDERCCYGRCCYIAADGDEVARFHA